MFASFMVHMIADGVSFSFGVFYVELLDYFQESKAKTAWVGALFVSVPLVAGPIASALTNKYGCRMVTIMGSIVATMGFLLSIAAPSLEILCITFGLISGLGLAMVYVPAVVIVAFYFEKRRAFATGLAVCGSGIGTFIFAPLTEYLIDEYGWRGTLLIQAGLLLNMCVCGACFRPLETSVQRKKRKFLRSLDKFSKNNSIAHSEQSLEEKSKCGHIQSTLSDISDFDETKLRLLIEPASQSLITIPTYLNAVDSTVYLSKYNQVNACHDLKKSQEGQNKEKEASTTEDGESTAPVKGSHPANISESHEDTLLKLNDLKEIVWHKQKVVNIKHRGRTSSQVSHPFLRKDIFYRGSLIKIAPCTIATCSKASSCPVLSQYQHEDAIAASVDGAPCQTLKFSKKVKGVMKEMLDVSILKNPKFVIFCVSNLILYMWYDVPYMFSTDRAIYLGISEALASFLVSILGIINTIGQVLYGYIGDIPSINPTLLYLVSITIAGVATMAMPLCTTYASMCIYATVFGFAISANFSLTTIILVDLIGMDRLTNAFGLVMLGQGVSNVIGPPIAGRHFFIHYFLLELKHLFHAILFLKAH